MKKQLNNPCYNLSLFNIFLIPLHNVLDFSYQTNCSIKLPLQSVYPFFNQPRLSTTLTSNVAFLISKRFMGTKPPLGHCPRILPYLAHKSIPETPLKIKGGFCKPSSTIKSTGLTHVLKRSSFLVFSISCTNIKRWYPGPGKSTIFKAIQGWYVSDLLPHQYGLIAKTAQVIPYDPHITKEYLRYWRNHNPILAGQIHAEYLRNKFEFQSPIKVSGHANVNSLTAKIVDYLTRINPRNELLEHFNFDRQISYTTTCDQDYISNLLYKFNHNEPISEKELTYVADLLERKLLDKTDNTFSNDDTKLYEYLLKIKNNIIAEKKATLNFESRDDFEFRQLYPNKHEEPLTEPEKAIKQFLSMKKLHKYITQQDFEYEMERKSLLKKLLREYSGNIDDKILLEIMRREGLLTNIDAGFFNHIPYPEGQGPKFTKLFYQNKNIVQNNVIEMSKEMKDYIHTCITKNDYKAYVGVNATSDNLILDNIQLHPCLAIPHPEDKHKLLIIGYYTSANIMGNKLLDKEQKDFPISQTTDKSKSPQFEQENFSYSENPLNNKQPKVQYFTFTKNLIVVDKTDFLENTLATYYTIKGLNHAFESIPHKITNFAKNILFKNIETPIVLNKQILIQIMQEFILNESHNFEDQLRKFTNTLKHLSNDELNKKLTDLEIQKRNYLLREEILLKEKVLCYYYPEIKNIIKIVKLLEEKKTKYIEEKRRKETAKKVELHKKVYEEKQKSKYEENKFKPKNQPMKAIESSPKQLQITYPKNEV